MKLLNKLTPMILTRSTTPFVFKEASGEKVNLSEINEYIEKGLNPPGLYVHIPFCRSLCNFCPYCKEVYNVDRYKNYIDALIKEIHLIGGNFKEKIPTSTLYFGGGSPCLAINDLDKIINTINKYFTINSGIGIELHPEDVNDTTLHKLESLGISKISIGIQSFQRKFQKTLGRDYINLEEMKKVIRNFNFETISMDFIFSLPNQNIDDLKKDFKTARELGANHVAFYPFIDFTFTKSRVKSLEKRKKRKLLDEITDYVLAQGFIRNSIWTFSEKENIGYSSMTRDNYIGFGVSAVTLLTDEFKINTFSIDSYCHKIDKGEWATSLLLKFSLRQRMIYYLFWTAYTTKISKKDFEKFFQKKLNKYYWLEFKIAKLLGFIKEENDEYILTKKGAFYYHYYENFYTLSYIDKMWNIMSKEAFPHDIQL